MYIGVVWDTRDENSSLGPESQVCCTFELYQSRLELLKYLTESPDLEFIKLAYIEQNGNLIEIVFQRGE